MKKALRKGSATSDEDSFVRRDDDDTDTEHQDSLPHDEEAKDRRFGLSRLQQIRRTRKPSLVDIVQIAKQERARAGSIAAGSSLNSGLQQQGSAGNFPVKEPHPKSRFKVEKHERRDRGSVKEKKDTKHKQPQQQPPPYESPKDNEHDPDTNSRIVSERRASLLRRNKEQHQGEDENAEPPTPDPPQTPSVEADTAEQTPPEESTPETPTLAKSKFHIVDEKKPPQDSDDKPLPTAKESAATGSGGGGGLEAIGLGKFKFRKHKMKSNNAVTKPEPEVFKFDERSVEKSSDVATTPAPEHLNSELSGVEETERSLPSPTPSQGQGPGHHQRQLSVLSRQGRKKIGNLLALVREAVNLKKDDVEQQAGSDESPGSTTPTYLAYTPPPPPSVLSSVSSSTALEMPPTPEPESPTPSAPLHFGCSTSSRPPVKPPKPPPPVIAAGATAPTATIDDLEELDLPGPITFPKRSTSQRRRPMRQDSQSSIWSDNIPTITISTTGSDECIVDASTPENGLPESRSGSPTGPTVNIIRINIEDREDEQNK